MFVFRLLLDALAVGLMIVCLAYWWLDNLSHEVIGTALFALLITHNVFNRRWYGALPRERHNPGRTIKTVAIFCLAAVMLVMLVTSLLISRDLFPFTALDGAFTVREIHMFTAYWALVLVGLHLGTRWRVVMTICSNTFGITHQSAAADWALRIIAAMIALNGICASLEMGLGAKLRWQYTLDMWDFNADASGFFLNYLAIVGLYVVIGHYGMRLVISRRRSRDRAPSREA